jgi:dTDP-D-glucose 4,6-dehydratase
VDNSNLEALGWVPEHSWLEALAATVAWHREHLDYWDDMAEALQPHYPEALE